MASSVHQFRYPGPTRELPERVIPQIMVAALAPTDWALSALDERHASFARQRWSTGTIAACVLLFPIGLLALLAGRRTETIAITWAAGLDGSTDVTITSVTTREARRYLAKTDGEKLYRQIHAGVPAVAV